MRHRPQSAENDPLIGQTFAGRYEIRTRLGAGGMAVVYGGHDRMLMRDVAIKILRPEAATDPTSAKRLQREATAAGQLHHPHIITFHDVGMTGDKLFIVMEQLNGLNLTETREAEGGSLDVIRASRIGAQIAAALSCVHGANIVHRDLKPENAFILQRNGADYVKLLDFSIAKLPEEMVDGRLTQTGTIFGTPYYMAPEQAMGDPVSFQTDLYALGAVLFELVAGRPPFQADNAIKLLAKQSMENAPTLASLGHPVPSAFEELVGAMLEKVPWHRPSTAQDVQATLERIVQAGFVPPRRKTGAERAKAKRKLAGKADTTIQGHYGGQPVGGAVRSPSAVFRRVSAQHEKPATPPPPLPPRKPARQPVRKRRSTVPSTAHDATPPAIPKKPTPPAPGRATQPRSVKPPRKTRATIPSWQTGKHPRSSEDVTIDESEPKG